MTLPLDSVITIEDTPVEAIRSISPSKYLSARRCPLSFVVSKSNVWQFNPQTSAAIVGSIIHRLIEWSGKSNETEITFEQAEAKFEELVSAAESKLNAHPINRRLVPLKDTDPRYPEKRHSAIKAAVRGPKHKKTDKPDESKGSTVFMYEEGFRSNDGLIYGEIDKLIDGPRGLTIYDKKTCHVFDDEGYVKDEYRMQLLLYAGLVYEDMGKVANRLVLVDRDDRETDIHFEFEEVLDAMTAASRWLTALNKKIQSTPSVGQLMYLAQPSQESCRFCSARVACPAYWKARQELNEEWPDDAEFVADSFLRLGNGGVLIKSRPVSLGRTIRVFPEFVQYQPALNLIEAGCRIRVTDVKTTGLQRTLTKRSVVYIIKS
jgi:hypothetical protein